MRRRRRLAAHGPNRLPEADRPGPLRRLAWQCIGLLIQVLLGAAAITVMLGYWVDTAVILLVVVANAALGFRRGSCPGRLGGLRHGGFLLAALRARRSPGR